MYENSFGYIEANEKVQSKEENKEQKELSMTWEACGKPCSKHNENWNPLFQDELSKRNQANGKSYDNKPQIEKSKNKVINKDLECLHKLRKSTKNF